MHTLDLRHVISDNRDIVPRRPRRRVRTLNVDHSHQFNRDQEEEFKVQIIKCQLPFFFLVSPISSRDPERSKQRTSRHFDSYRYIVISLYFICLASIVYNLRQMFR